MLSVRSCLWWRQSFYHHHISVEKFKMSEQIIPAKRQQRETYRKAHSSSHGLAELPKKKFYRQRAHANPFSDHHLI